MFRSLTVAVLVVALAVSGCTHQQPAPLPIAQDTSQEAGDTLRKYSRQENWIENYPLLEAMTNTTAAFFLGVAVGALLVIALYVGLHSE
jgi:hypothetical protein